MPEPGEATRWRQSDYGALKAAKSLAPPTPFVASSLLNFPLKCVGRIELVALPPRCKLAGRSVSENLQIAVEFLGLDQEEGHLRLDAFMEELNRIMRSMEQVDRLIDGKESAYFRIIRASHNDGASKPGALEITLAPTRIERVKNPVPESRIVAFHHRYFDELSKIQEGGAPSSEIDDDTLKLLDKVADGDGVSYKSLRILNHARSVEIDQIFKRTVHRLLADQVVSNGTLTGALDAMNVHGEGRFWFWIYPSTGPTRVRCHAPAEFRDLITRNPKRIVRVEGAKYYRPNSAHPHKIHVENVELAPQVEHLNSIRGALRDAGTEPLTASRDAWE
jgi:hypothetical protein